MSASAAVWLFDVFLFVFRQKLSSVIKRNKIFHSLHGQNFLVINSFMTFGLLMGLNANEKNINHHQAYPLITY